ncbi:hypothetical protein AGLY_000429 [Aphis glycines]|uniref:Uncharacterized protein n=1 Tax=Aphis glycines TaxID=307491 RepID=A0A6G0U9J1_APHGL|nr:hypothetical protein AGLY_000429 [Aphis glycines]
MKATVGLSKAKNTTERKTMFLQKNTRTKPIEIEKGNENKEIIYSKICKKKLKSLMLISLEKNIKFNINELINKFGLSSNVLKKKHVWIILIKRIRDNFSIDFYFHLFSTQFNFVFLEIFKIYNVYYILYKFPTVNNTGKNMILKIKLLSQNNERTHGGVLGVQTPPRNIWFLHIIICNSNTQIIIKYKKHIFEYYYLLGIFTIGRSLCGFIVLYFTHTIFSNIMFLERLLSISDLHVQLEIRGGKPFLGHVSNFSNNDFKKFSRAQTSFFIILIFCVPLKFDNWHACHKFTTPTI